MIIKSSSRGLGGLAAHLLRADTNEAVLVTTARDVEANVAQALLQFGGIGAAAGCQRPLLHVIVNPSPTERTPNDADWSTVWEMYEGEFGLQSCAFIEVQHTKRQRSHRHRLYCRVDPNTLGVVRDSFSRVRNEKVARLAEIAMGHALTFGRHHERVVKEIIRKRPELMDALRAHAEPSARIALNANETQQGERVGTDPRAFRRAVWTAFEAASGDWGAFAQELDRREITIARGDRTIVALDERTGFCTSLARVLNQEAKARGAPVRLVKADVEAVFGRARSWKDERQTGFERSRQHDLADEAGHRFRLMFEALAAADLASVAAEKAEREREQEQDRAKKEARRSLETLEQQRRTVRECNERARRKRQRRVDRAFRAARLARCRPVRNLLAIVAGGSALISGFGLGPALIAAYIARHAAGPLIGAWARASASERDEEPVAGNRARKPSEPVRAGGELSSNTRDRFDFREIDRRDRVLAGLYIQWLLQRAPANKVAIAEACVAALGEETSKSLRMLVSAGRPGQIDVIRRWYDNSARGMRAAAAALARHQQNRAAASLWSAAREFDKQTRGVTD